MPRVVLYNPRAHFFDMPLALLAIASGLDGTRFDVQIIDGRLEDDPHQQLVDAARDAVCVGMTVLTGAPILDAMKAAERVRRAHPHVPVVWGGWHPSLFPKAVLRDVPAVDVTVQGQGEVTFAMVVERLANGESLDAVEGITFRSSDGMTQNAPRAMVDMNTLPTVRYDTIDCARYFERKGQRQLDFVTSTGCLFRCAFCADPHVYQRRFTQLEPSRIVERLVALHRRTGFEDLNFQDETFFTYPKRSVEMAEGMLEAGLNVSWAATMRADQCHRINDEAFALLRRSGLRRVLMGVETGTQEGMDWLKKDIRLTQVWEGAERCRQLGLSVIFPFIVGFPGESDASVEASLQLAYALRQMSPRFTTPIFYFKPYPGSELTREVVEAGYALPSSTREWAEFDYIGSSGPWVDPDRRRQVERFKFYNRLAGARGRWYSGPLQQLARWRCAHGRLRWPIEQRVIERFRQEPTLS